MQKLLSHQNDFCLIPLGKYASLEKSYKKIQKNSNFEIFESTLYMKSGSGF